ncbi:MAG: ferritin-like domain-containing protein [Byssovorax sp.]
MIGIAPPTREQLVHRLYEAAELEHNLMCTYLYSAFSLRDPDSEGLSTEESAAVARWRAAILNVAVEEMGHLTAVWNITAALGAAPRFGRTNFPLEAGILPAGVVVRLAPFSAASLQHFIHLERPETSAEPEGEGFNPEFLFTRGMAVARLTPMALDYETVGTFYATLGENLRAFVAHHGEKAAFCGDPALQLGPDEVALLAARPVVCLKTALAAFTAIVEQGEGAPEHSVGSHYQKFAAIREELAALLAVNPAFKPAFPAASNPVLRRPIRSEGRVWIEDERAAATVDLANTGYALMLRLLAYSYVVPRPRPEKALSVTLALGLMRAVTHLAEHAARLPAGPSNPGCNAGMSFTALRDSAPLLPGPSAAPFFLERLDQMVEAAKDLASDGDARAASALRILVDLAKRAARGFQSSTATTAPVATALVAAAPVATAPVAEAPAGSPPVPTVIDGVEHIPGKKLTLLFEAKKCIHSRFCVTGAPSVFIANIKGPWINPDAIPVESLVEIAHVCPSGAIRYQRLDGVADESAPPVNLIGTREAGPYAFRGDLRLDGESIHTRATLCRCGASKNKPYCDGSHHEVGFAASGEPPTGTADMRPVRNGPLAIDPELDGPLQIRGNVEIVSGTGRVVARVTQARLCRCGGSKTKPFCDGTHARIGFKSS